MVFFLMPSARTIRIAKAEDKVKLILKKQNGRMASGAEVKEIIHANGFLVRAIDKAPSLYLFVPSLNVNVAVLARLRKITPGFDGYSVYIIPRPNRESPTTEKAVGMCLSKDGTWHVPDLIKAAPDMASSKTIVDEEWSKLNSDDKARIGNLMRVNESIQRKYGELSVLVVDGKKGYLMENWFDLTDFLDVLKKLHQAGG